jgi:hypothetical protein
MTRDSRAVFDDYPAGGPQPRRSAYEQSATTTRHHGSSAQCDTAQATGRGSPSGSPIGRTALSAWPARPSQGKGRRGSLPPAGQGCCGVTSPAS